MVSPSLNIPMSVIVAAAVERLSTRSVGARSSRDEEF